MYFELYWRGYKSLEREKLPDSGFGYVNRLLVLRIQLAYTLYSWFWLAVKRKHNDQAKVNPISEDSRIQPE